MTVRHPTPQVLARHLREVASTLDRHGLAAIDRAATLAERGFPAATLGDGTGGGSTSTSVERALGIVEGDDQRDEHGNKKPASLDLGHNRWAGIDEALALELRLIWTVGLRIQKTVADVLAQADDADATPAGTGSCTCCGRFCRPTADKPHDRISAGFCPACREAWRRWRRTNTGDRQTFVRYRRAALDAESRAAQIKASYR